MLMEIQGNCLFSLVARLRFVRLRSSGGPVTAAREKGQDRDGEWVEGPGSRGGKGKDEAGGTGKEAPARNVDKGEEGDGTTGKGESGGRPRGRWNLRPSDLIRGKSLCVAGLGLTTRTLLRFPEIGASLGP